jgi:nucleotide-binding universal stress UspA family protein
MKNEVTWPEVIVVGIDASDESNTALAWAREAAGPETRILAVHGWEMPLVTGFDVVVPIDPNELEEAATDALHAVVDPTGDERIEPIVRNGHAGRVVIVTAENNDADMIVVGHRGRGRMSMMLGSTANYILHHSKVPVVVMRGEDIGRPARVVVGVDDHDLSEGCDNESVRALQWAYRLPGVETVVVTHGWFLPALAVGTMPPMFDDLDRLDAAAREVVDRVVAAAGPAPEHLEIVPEPARGTGAFTLIEASRHSDLVVVGSRGRGSFREVLLGSTSAEVAAYSHAPVVVVR